MTLAVIANMNYGYEEIYGVFKIKTDTPFFQLKRRYRWLNNIKTVHLNDWEFLKWCEEMHYIEKVEHQQIFI